MEEIDELYNRILNNENWGIGDLDKLIDLELVHKQKIGKENFYINKDLYAFLHDAPQIHHL